MAWNGVFTVFAGETWFAIARVGVEVWRVVAFGVVFAVQTVVGAWDWVVARGPGVEAVASAGLKTG